MQKNAIGTRTLFPSQVTSGNRKPAGSAINHKKSAMAPTHPNKAVTMFHCPDPVEPEHKFANKMMTAGMT